MAAQVDPFDEGLFLQRDWLTPEHEQDLLEEIEKQEWNTKISRRTQHYGREYVYSKKTTAGKAPPLDTVPEIEHVGNLLFKYHFFDRVPEEALVNEYYRNQGIAAHTDAKVFGPVVVSISLNADCVMKLSHPTRCPVPIDIFLPRRSLLVMEDAVRYEWKHEIPKTVRYFDDEGVQHTKPDDYRRISLTYRTFAR